MRTKKIFSYTLAAMLLATASSCDLTEVPVDTATNAAVFGSESGLDLYVGSFYNLLPDPDVGVFQIDDNSDLVARNGECTEPGNQFRMELDRAAQHQLFY
jgi:hypothetical protein